MIFYFVAFAKNVGWVKFCFAAQNKMQPIKVAKKNKMKREKSPFIDGLQASFAFAKVAFHPSYASLLKMLDVFYLKPLTNPRFCYLIVFNAYLPRAFFSAIPETPSRLSSSLMTSLIDKSRDANKTMT